MKTKIHIKSNKIVFYLVFLGFFAFWGNEVLASPITERSVLELLNQARVEKGLAPLEANNKLFQVASDKADDMLKNNYFAHTSPKGITPWVWFDKEGYNYKFAGENLAINFSSAEDQQKAWMESETHRKNILDTNYQEVGLAVKKGFINGKLATVTVQEFGTQTAYAGNGAGKSVIAKNSLPEVQMNLLQNFNGKLLDAGEKLSGSIMGAQNKTKFMEYLGDGSATVILVIILLNSLILLWIILDSFFGAKKKELDISNPSFNLYTISREEYLEFLKRLSISSGDSKTIYLEQMKLRR